MFRSDISELLLRGYVVDLDLAPLHHFADIEKTEGYVLCASAENMVAEDVERSHVLDVQRCAANSASNPNSTTIFEHKTASFTASAATTLHL